MHTVVFYITDRAVGAGKQPVRTSFTGKPRGAVFYSVILFDKLWHEQHTVPLCTATSLDLALGFLPGFHFFLLSTSLLLLMHWAPGTLSQISASCRNLPACNLTCLVTSSLQRKQGIYINKQKSAQDGKQQQQKAVPVLPCPCASVCSWCSPREHKVEIPHLMAISKYCPLKFPVLISRWNCIWIIHCSRL